MAKAKTKIRSWEGKTRPTSQVIVEDLRSRVLGLLKTVSWTKPLRKPNGSLIGFPLPKGGDEDLESYVPLGRIRGFESALEVILEARFFESMSNVEFDDQKILFEDSSIRQEIKRLMSELHAAREQTHNLQLKYNANRIGGALMKIHKSNVRAGFSIHESIELMEKAFQEIKVESILKS